MLAINFNIVFFLMLFNFIDIKVIIALRTKFDISFTIHFV